MQMTLAYVFYYYLCAQGTQEPKNCSTVLFNNDKIAEKKPAVRTVNTQTLNSQSYKKY